MRSPTGGSERMTPPSRRHFRRGIAVTGGLALGLAMLALALLLASHDGRCGGYFPGLSAPRPCSRWDFVAADGPAIVLVLGADYWPLLLALPPAIGRWRDRRR